MKLVTEKTKQYLLSVGYPNNGEIYYLDAWLWLWREKKAEIDMQVLSYARGRVRVWPDYFKSSKVFEFNDPEEAIAKAIDYLVENKLLK